VQQRGATCVQRLYATRIVASALDYTHPLNVLLISNINQHLQALCFRECVWVPNCSCLLCVPTYKA
jgi:hypothetical protein